MASIFKRGPHQYQTQVRRKGYPTQTQTFETKRDAEDWSKTVESEMRRGVFIDRSEAERTTLLELLTRYESEVTPVKRGKVAEFSRLRRLKQHHFAVRYIATLKSSDFAAYRDERLKEAAPKTVQHELSLLSSVFNVAKRDWSIPVENPVLSIRKPKLPGVVNATLSVMKSNVCLSQQAPLTNVTDDSRTMFRDGLAPRRAMTPQARTNDVSVISALPFTL